MVLSMDRWVGKVAIVTGASAGIGAAIAEALVKNGLQVVGLARRHEKVEDLSKKLGDKKGKLYAFKADMTKEEEIIQAFEWVKKNLGPVHILINNAGGAEPTTLIDGDTTLWKRTFDLNVLGLCIATREAVKDMRENNVDGHIIHINSIVGHRVINAPFLNVYQASKFAVTALTETLRNELNSIGSKIKITSLSPGATHTEAVQRALNQEASVMPKEMQDMFEKMPFLSSEDIADATVYVLSTPPHVQVHELIIQPVGTPM